MEDRLLLATFVVINTNDDTNPGSLRWAIGQVDADGTDTAAAPDQITFDIPAGGTTIALGAALPAITNPVVIDATGQSGFAGTPVVAIDGAGATGDGLVLGPGSAGSTILGLDLYGFTAAGAAAIHVETADNTIENNYLGTDTTGNALGGGVGNAIGLLIDDAPDNTVGGESMAGNLISGNGIGVEITGAAATGNLVQGNRIGTQADGTSNLGNTGDGVLIAAAASVNTIGDNDVAAVPSALANTIAFNGGAGVDVTSTGANTILSNSIFQNVGAGIVNTAGPAAPTLTGATSFGTTTLVQGTIAGPAGTYTLEFFSNPTADPVGLEQGKTYIGSATVTIPNGAFSASLPVAEPIGSFVTATVTSMAGAAFVNTSAFSHDATVADPFLVTNTNDDGPGSLRQAIAIANIHPGLDTITFALPAGPDEIDLNNGLVVYDPVVIDGTDGGHRVIISGKNFTNASNPGDLLTLTSGTFNSPFGPPVTGLDSSGSTVENLAFVADAFGAGVRITTDNNTLVDDYFGTPDLTAEQPLAYGVLIDGSSGTASHNHIGGGDFTDATKSNVFVATTNDAVLIQTDGGHPTQGSGNTVSGNDIGALPAGAASGFGNGNGVVVLNAADNTIGGATAHSGNVISGNVGDGIQVVAASGNAVQNNLIGLAPDGITALGNGGNGIQLRSSTNQVVSDNTIDDNASFGVSINNGGANQLTNNTIHHNAAGGIELANGGNTVSGGTVDSNTGSGITIDNSAGNTITGVQIYLNTVDGVLITGAGATGNSVASSDIGTDSAGTAGLGNTHDGVEIAAGAAGNSIGDTDATAVPSPLANTIAFNGGAGVDVTSTGANTILSNSIFQNVGAGIVNANGPAAPVFSGATSFGGITLVEGTLAGPAGTYTLEFFSNPTADPVGLEQGKTYIGSATVTIPDGTFSATVPGTVPLGSFVTATVTSMNGAAFVNTSAFSNDATVVKPFEVTNTKDNTLIGSLRAAIDHVNADTTDTAANPDTITFNIPTTDPGFNPATMVYTISPASALPTVTRAATIDATTQPGHFTAPVIVLDGTNAGATSDGLDINAPSTTVEGFAIRAFQRDGIEVAGATATADTIGGAAAGQGNVITGNAGNGIQVLNGAGGALVVGNTIGGAGAPGNGLNGVFLNNVAGNTVGQAPLGSNLISGNGTLQTADMDNGVLIAGANATNNVVAFNLIGTDKNGAAAVPNLGNGVEINGGAHGNTIGGAAAAPVNVISGNANDGVRITGTNTDGNLVLGNFIGTNQAGTAAIANGNNGVEIAAKASGNTIGGTTPAPSNVISGNGDPTGNGNGVLITGAGTVGNLVQGNYIGTDKAGTAAIANGFAGVLIEGAATNNTIGGTTAAARNIVSGNTGSDGVIIFDASNNFVRGNYIGTDKNGTTALGNAGNGVLIFSDASGSATGNVVDAGNVISGNAGDGVLLTGAATHGNTIAGNIIGLTAAGAVLTIAPGVQGNQANGVEANSLATGNTIGGATLAAANTIAGNTQSGVLLIDTGTSAVVENNFIGTDSSNTTGLGNLFDGVLIDNVTTDTVGPGNVIAGNQGNGIQVRNGSTGITIIGNTIGGAGALGNGLNGVFLNNVGGNTVGATGLPPSNAILGNGTANVAGSQDGVLISGPLAANNTIEENAIGSGAAPNLGNGVEVLGAGAGNAITVNAIAGNALNGVFLNGTAAGVSINTISGSGLDGVRVSAVTTDTIGPFNVITGNLGNGIQVLNSSTGIVIVGNTIGAVGAPGNGLNGVFLNNVGGNTVGATPAAGMPSNVISGNGTANVAGMQNGVLISGGLATGNTVEGDYIGTDRTGKTAAPNLGNGVAIVGAGGNTIGATPAAGVPANVISGNASNGILIVGDIVGARSANNLVEGNYIGTDVTGASTLSVAADGPPSNGGNGVLLAAGATANRVSANVISGNGGDGVLITGVNSANNVVAGNDIGTDATGTKLLTTPGNASNLGNGVEINAAAGGNTVNAGNVISGNGKNGILVTGTTAVIQGNDIGTDRNGNAATLGNRGDGIRLDDVTTSVNVEGGPSFPGGFQVTGSATPETIGGTAAGQGNLIAGNAGNGIQVLNGSTPILIVGNTIGGAGALGNGLNGVFLNNVGGNTVGATPAAGMPSNVISGNGTANVAGMQNGVLIAGASATGNSIEGDYIGTDATGKTAVPNLGNGVAILGAGGNTIGATAGPGVPANLISGNGNDGILILGPAAASNLIEGNYIGTDLTGASALMVAAGSKPSNGGNGVSIAAGATATSVIANLISGNGGNGVLIGGAGTIGNLVAGNTIGLGVAGGALVVAAGAKGGNQVNGVAVASGASGTVIAGNNVISGNVGDGVRISDASTNLVTGNLIGLSPNGKVAIANLGNGVAIVSDASGTSTGNSIGNGNVISGNSGDGVLLTGAGTSGNFVSGNTIGLDQGRAVPVGNVRNGVEIAAGASGNGIGVGNVISGNDGDGILITGQGTTNNLVTGNYVGSDPAGVGAIGNVGNGVEIAAGASGNLIVTGNIISGSVGDGVLITGQGTNANQVVNNLIGVGSSGLSLSNQGNGVAITSGASGNTIGGVGTGAGNTIGGNALDGILIDASTGNLVVQNSIGTDGSRYLSNGGDGVAIASGASGNTIGGTLGGTGNLISGNRGNGVAITGPTTAGNSLQGNLIGTDRTGNGPLLNALNGVVIINASKNAIGGQLNVTGNVIGGNLRDGVLIAGQGATGNVLLGNLIGNNHGDLAVANGANGVELQDFAVGNVVGGATAATMNVISGNGANGVAIIGPHASGNVVQGNHIGTDPGGTLALANLQDGVLIAGGASGNTIGGQPLVAGNQISGNLLDGVAIVGASNNLVPGDLIGTDITGTVPLPNLGNGVSIVNGSVGNVIGAGDVISGNGLFGVFLFGAANNQVQGDLIGTDITGQDNGPGGTGTLGNALGGVEINNAPANTVGGTSAASRNVISGNGVANFSDGFLFAGTKNGTPIDDSLSPSDRASVVLVAYKITANVRILGAGSALNDVEGNFIGTDSTGTRDVTPVHTLTNPNVTPVGVYILDASNNTVGGTAAGASNVISGNDLTGVDIRSTAIDGTSAAGNLVAGNIIGLDASGAARLAGSTFDAPTNSILFPINDPGALPTGAGVFINGASGNTIGGSSPAARNVISGNSLGIEIIGDQQGVPAAQSRAAGSHNVIQGNFIGLDQGGTIGGLGNSFDGILVVDAADTLIGSRSVTSTAASGTGGGNVITANGGSGIHLLLGNTQRTIIQGNTIGALAGNRQVRGLGNEFYGILFDDQVTNTPSPRFNDNVANRLGPFRNTNTDIAGSKVPFNKRKVIFPITKFPGSTTPLGPMALSVGPRGRRGG